MRTIQALAALALGATLAGCIVLPPPPPAHALPPFAHRGPPPEAFALCAGQPEGARFEMPGRRADVLTGTCVRGPDGRLMPRPDGAR